MANNVTYRGSSMFTLLGIAFVVLKLTDKIDWSWWWVLAPFWIPIVFTIIVAGVILGFFRRYL